MHRLLIAALAVLPLAASGCRKDDDGKLEVGFSQMENNGPWRLAETASMKDEAARRSDRFRIVVTDALGQTSKQVSDVEDLIARRVDAIFLAPREFEGLVPALDAAAEAGIPVFLIDRMADGEAGKHYVSFLGSNFIEQGRRAGEWMAKATAGVAGIVELTGTAGSSVAADRGEGFRAGIAGHPGMTIIASQTGDFSRAAGQKVMENIIQAKGEAITAVYAHNDEMALGAIQALRAAGRRPGQDVTIVSIDGQRSALEAILAGEMNASVESNPRFGPLAFDALERRLRGEVVPAKLILEDRLFDASNAAELVDEAF